MELDGIGSIAAALIAAGALFVAWRARRDSRRSADASDRSADASERSAVAAERAAEITDLEARRRVERSDVAWRVVDGLETGIVRYQNVGSHEAFDVTVVLTINDQRINLDRAQVPPGAHIEWDARGIYQEAKRDNDRRDAEAARSGLIAIFLPRFEVSARISWQSELGSPGIVTLG